MNVFELAIFLGLLAIPVFGAKALGQIFGVTPWVFGLPIVVAEIIIIRAFGKWAKAHPPPTPLPRKRKPDEK